MSTSENATLISYGKMLYPKSKSCDITMGELLKIYINQEYGSVKAFANTIGIARSTLYEYLRGGMPDDVFVIICFKLRPDPLKIMELINKGTGFKLCYNGDDRNSVIVRYLIGCYDNNDIYNLDSCNAELRVKGLRLIGENA